MTAPAAIAEIEPEVTAPPVLGVNMYTNGFGDWHAQISFSHTLSESDPRPEFNLEAQWERIRRTARRAVLAEILDREQRRQESREQVAARIHVEPLVVIEQDVDAQNRWHGVTIGEGRDL